MRQQTLDGVDLTARRRRYRDLVDRRLPAAAGEDWPIQADHCFERVVLDTLAGGVWYDHVDGRPAYRHLSAEELDAAIGIATAMLDHGRPLVAELNDNSLRWREKRADGR